MSHEAATIEAGKITVDLSAICREGRALVRLAVMLGWYARNTNAGGVLLTSSQNKGQKISVPAKSNIQDHKLSAWADRVARYADPVKLLAAEAHADKASRDTMDVRDSFAWQAWVDPVSDDIPDHAVFSDPEPEEPEPPRPAPLIVSERPWLAKNGHEDGRRYESQAVIERKWSDGTTDYLCALDGCGFTSPIPQTVAGHYRASKDHPKIVGPVRQLKGEPYEVKHRSASQRAAHLAAQIAAALEDIGTDLADFASYTELAVEVAEAIIAERDANRDVEETERGPLTPEQLLDKIRVLVDNGSTIALREQNDTLNERVAELEVAAAECRQRAEDAENEAALIRSEWDALCATIQQRPPHRE